MHRVVVLLCCILAVVTLRADDLSDKIQNILGDDVYAKQQRLLKIVFRDEQAYYKKDKSQNETGDLDVVAIIKTLKENGFINLVFDSPKTLNITFITYAPHIIFKKIIDESLSASGYNSYEINRASKIRDSSILSIAFKTRYIVDPSSIQNELDERGCYIEDILKENSTSWFYEVRCPNPKISSAYIRKNTSLKLNRTLEPYWLSFDDTNTINIKSYVGDRWYPDIAFFDKDLNIISYFKKENTRGEINLNIPKNAKYVKISDFYTLDNVKKGLYVYIYDR